MSIIKHIVFDLGNVIIDLDIPRTKYELDLLLKSSSKQEDLAQEFNQVIKEYEVGAISSELFINHIIKNAQPQVFAQQVIRAWNAMLIDIPSERLAFLKSLKEMGYGIYLLSNTNHIHLDWVNRYMSRNHEAPSLDPWFDKSYYSHLINKRKPDLSCFEYVLADAGIEAEHTLFIDDMYENIKGAEAARMRTLYLTGGHEVINSLKSYLNIND